MPGLRAAVWSVAGAAVRWTAAIASRAAAVGPNHRPAQKFGGFGDGSLLGWPTGPVFGEQWIWIGSDTLIAPHVTLSAGMAIWEDTCIEPVVRIGDRCLIGRGTAIVGHLAIDIGDDVYTGMNVYITDQNHGYEDLNLPIGVQAPSGKPVTIGPGSWIGSGAVVLPGARIGAHVVVGANSVVRGEIPDYSVVVGVPGRVVRRHDGTRWRRVGEALDPLRNDNAGTN